MVIFWLIALVVFIIVEASTVGLVSIWFAVGALASFISALLRFEVWLQIVLFVVVSAVTIVFTRPLSKKYLAPKHKRTNADRVMDMLGVVTERIDNLNDTGAVHVGGKLWSARSENGLIIEAGEKVSTVRIEGVKLIVVPQKKTESVDSVN